MAGNVEVVVKLNTRTFILEWLMNGSVLLHTTIILQPVLRGYNAGNQSEKNANTA